MSMRWVELTRGNPGVRDHYQQEGAVAALEQAFAKLKAFFRAARPRSFDDVCALMRDALPRYTPTECGHYMQHAGYRLPTRL